MNTGERTPVSLSLLGFGMFSVSSGFDVAGLSFSRPCSHF